LKGVGMKKTALPSRHVRLGRAPSRRGRVSLGGCVVGRGREDRATVGAVAAGDTRLIEG
jgi:hypothetical protein